MFGFRGTIIFDHVTVNTTSSPLFITEELGTYWFHVSGGIPADSQGLTLDFFTGVQYVTFKSNLSTYVHGVQSFETINKLSSGIPVYLRSQKDVYSDEMGQLSFFGLRLDVAFSPLVAFQGITSRSTTQGKPYPLLLGYISLDTAGGFSTSTELLQGSPIGNQLRYSVYKPPADGIYVVSVQLQFEAPINTHTYSLYKEGAFTFYVLAVSHIYNSKNEYKGVAALAKYGTNSVTNDIGIIRGLSLVQLNATDKLVPAGITCMRCLYTIQGFLYRPISGQTPVAWQITYFWQNDETDFNVLFNQGNAFQGGANVIIIPRAGIYFVALTTHDRIDSQQGVVMVAREGSSPIITLIHNVLENHAGDFISGYQATLASLKQHEVLDAKCRGCEDYTTAQFSGFLLFPTV